MLSQPAILKNSSTMNTVWIETDFSLWVSEFDYMKLMTLYMVKISNPKRSNIWELHSNLNKIVQCCPHCGKMGITLCRVIDFKWEYILLTLLEHKYTRALKLLSWPINSTLDTLSNENNAK